MKKIIIAMSILLLLSGCGKNAVSTAEYMEMVSDGEYYIEKCEQLEPEVQELSAELEELEDDIAEMEEKLVQLELQIEEQLQIAENPELVLAPVEEENDGQGLNFFNGTGSDTVELSSELTVICKPYGRFPGIRFAVPADFTASDMLEDQWFNAGSESWYWIAPDFPFDTSSVSAIKSVDDPVGTDYTEESYRRSMELGLALNGQEDAEMELVAFEKTEGDGYDKLYTVIQYEVSDITVEQIVVMIDIDNVTYTIAYTIIADYDWHDIFMESVNSIEIYYE